MPTSAYLVASAASRAITSGSSPGISTVTLAILAAGRSSTLASTQSFTATDTSRSALLSQDLRVAGLAHVGGALAAAERVEALLADDGLGDDAALVVEQPQQARLGVLGRGILQLEQPVAVLVARLALDQLGADELDEQGAHRLGLGRVAALVGEGPDVLVARQRQRLVALLQLDLGDPARLGGEAGEQAGTRHLGLRPAVLRRIGCNGDRHRQHRDHRQGGERARLHDVSPLPVAGGEGGPVRRRCVAAQPIPPMPIRSGTSAMLANLSQPSRRSMSSRSARFTSRSSRRMRQHVAAELLDRLPVGLAQDQVAALARASRAWPAGPAPPSAWPSAPAPSRGSGARSCGAGR